MPALALAVLVYWAGRVLEVRAERLLASALLTATVLAIIAWLRTMRALRALVWDGGAWALDGERGDLRLMIDLGVGMLVAFTPGDRRGVTWLAIGDAGRPRHLLRAALHASPRPDRVTTLAGADREL